MPLRRIRRSKRKQPLTPRLMPESPKKKKEVDDESKITTDVNNNTPRVIAETVFPPGIPGILKGTNIALLHGPAEDKGKTRHRFRTSPLDTAPD
ncbi:hypothetical protein PUN28_008206 [Cardiocondyla obscurior]|uniref:Uncharacterized protein n=1 Tax=Cardiocondyla obscurior TaxID=286306 RepID=A0AAW2G2V0_9HYME